MTVTITAEHIAAGERNQSCKCPIAYAILDLTGEQVEVGETDLSHRQTAIPICDLPPVAQEFIRRFDAGQHVEPIEFELECDYFDLEGDTSYGEQF